MTISTGPLTISFTVKIGHIDTGRQRDVLVQRLLSRNRFRSIHTWVGRGLGSNKISLCLLTHVS